jgi:UDPglucose--hexose-1-phosphate uridylyltransferase
VRKISVRLADGRELIYFGAVPDRPDDHPDLRTLSPAEFSPEQRYDPLLGEWILVASHRRGRAFQPDNEECPLCPSTVTHRTEVPAPAYEVVVFENRYPALASRPGPGEPAVGLPSVVTASTAIGAHHMEDLLLQRPAGGRCEVICFSQDHNASVADLSPQQLAVVMDALTDRTAELSRLPDVEQVFCFENRGRAVGPTVSHPHGQIYAYPFTTPRTARMLSRCASYRQRTGLNLFDQMLAAELDDGSRIVVKGDHWIGFVPHATRWAYNLNLYPTTRVPDLTALSTVAKDELCTIYLDAVRRFDRLFDAPVPYISALHQAPVRQGRDEFSLHIELFTPQRAPGLLQYLAGSELGMGVFATDMAAETIAERLRQLG